MLHCKLVDSTHDTSGMKQKNGEIIPILIIQLSRRCTKNETSIAWNKSWTRQRTI